MCILVGFCFNIRIWFENWFYLGIEFNICYMLNMYCWNVKFERNDRYVGILLVMFVKDLLFIWFIFFFRYGEYEVKLMYNVYLLLILLFFWVIVLIFSVVFWFCIWLYFCNFLFCICLYVYVFDFYKLFIMMNF